MPGHAAPSLAKIFKRGKERFLWRRKRQNIAFNHCDSWRIRPRKPSSPKKGRVFLPDTTACTISSSGGSSAWAGGLPFFYPTPAEISKDGGLVWSNLPQYASTSSLRRLVYTSFLRLGAWFVLKLKYKGKSFRWHRRKSSLLLRFGHSHLVKMSPGPSIRWRKKGRMKMIFFGTNAWSLRRFLQNVVRWRPMNIYHGRGLRLTRQKVWRKSGKVSAYR